MFLVQKAISSPHFRSSSKKLSSQSHLVKTYQIAAKSFDETISHHLKTLTSPSSISLTYLSKLTSFLTSVHTEAEHHITNLDKSGSEGDEYEALYMEYSLKVLDLCNLMTSSVQKMTEKRLLMNFGVKLLSFTDVEKLNKAKDVIDRSVNGLTEYSVEKMNRAKVLIRELTVMTQKLPLGKIVSNSKDLVARVFHALGLLTVVIGNVFVSVLFGESYNSVRVPAEFDWADSVNVLQEVMFDQMKENNKVLEVDDVAKQAMIVLELIDDVSTEGRVRLVDSVKDMEMKVKLFSDGVDALNNGVNGMFRTVLKTRNGRLYVN